ASRQKILVRIMGGYVRRLQRVQRTSPAQYSSVWQLLDTVKDSHDLTIERILRFSRYQIETLKILLLP
ncbi:hypothetical protein L9F63_004233, partial [Diploptera punctata]